MRCSWKPTWFAVLIGMGLGGCDSNRPAEFAGPDAGMGVAPTATIPVNRDGCTPFGNPPRPQADALALTNPLLCAVGGERLPDWLDPQGTTRQACYYEADGASAEQPLPLIFWLQGSLVPAELQLEAGNVLSQRSTADLTGDEQRRGFILVELAGRITDHYYPPPNNSGTSGWDVWDRQFLPGAKGRVVNGEYYPLNLDAAAIDHYIAEVLKTGKVDESRVYMMGWSNGAGLAMLYAMNRGHIAAAAVYSAPNPFDALSDPCGQKPVGVSPRDDSEVQVFNPGVPLFHVINNCDIYSICPTGVRLHDTLLTTGAASSVFQIIDSSQASVEECLASCGTDPRGTDYTDLTQLPVSLIGAYGTLLHARWPRQRTEDMFSFLRDHPLPN